MSENALIRPSRCRTCTYWQQIFPQNQSLGVCPRMGVTQWPGRAHVTVTSNDLALAPALSDFPQCTTSEGFGCVLHSDYVMTQLSGTV